MFEWVQNTPLKTFLHPFDYSFLINISSRSYICTLSNVFIAIIFIAIKAFTQDVNEISILSKLFKFFLNYHFNDQTRLSSSFPKEGNFAGINVQICIKISTLMFVNQGVNKNRASANKGEEGSKFWSFCENVILECPLSYYIFSVTYPMVEQCNHLPNSISIKIKFQGSFVPMNSFFKIE